MRSTQKVLRIFLTAFDNVEVGVTDVMNEMLDLHKDRQKEGLSRAIGQNWQKEKAAIGGLLKKG